MRFFLIILFILTASVTLSYAQKVAVVDEAFIVKQYKPFLKVDSELKVIAGKWNDTATAYEKMMKQRADDFKTKSSTLKPQERQAQMDTLAGMQQALNNYRNGKTQQPNGEYWKERAKLLEPVIAKYKQAVTAVAKREGIDLVFNKAGVSYSTTTDITQKVLQELK